MMTKKNKTPRTLSQYLRLKAKEWEVSESELSKLIVPGSSGSLIATIRFDESKISEEKIKMIAKYFNEDPIMLTFMAGKIPTLIYKMIINSVDLQETLIDILELSKNNKVKLYSNI